MSLQRRLMDVLSEVVDVERVNVETFVLHSSERDVCSPVQLLASESDLHAYVEHIAPDALAALGEVGGDPRGLLAAIGLIAVHIEEEMGADAPARLTRLRVGPDGLFAERS